MTFRTSQMLQGRIVSVNVGKTRELEWRGRSVRTGIYKEPVLGEVYVGQLNLHGDAQADLRVHGGVNRAVYVYPSEHYPFWREQFPDLPLPWGMFGENLTTEGILESDVSPGDYLHIGSTELVVTKPRFPCYKLGIKFGTEQVIKTFFHSGRTGFYLSVFKEGYLEAGDRIEMVLRSQSSETIEQITLDKRRRLESGT